MKIKISGQKTNSYYKFLLSIGEDVPKFSDAQVTAINYLSSLLPLVRRHEFLIIKKILHGECQENNIREHLKKEIYGYTYEQFNHALKFMIESNVITHADNMIKIRCEIEPEFTEYIDDLLEYGLTQYSVRYTSDEEDFLLYQDYRQDQALLKILENPKHNQYGSYYKNDKMYIFAGLKKDSTIQEHLNYKDKFIDNETFQWESIANISAKDEQLQRDCKEAFIFVRKVKSENGITLPYTFVGTGQLQNPRKNATTNGSILYDIHLNNALPDDLMEDFQWIA
jgi:hypothetical protein